VTEWGFTETSRNCPAGAGAYPRRGGAGASAYAPRTRSHRRRRISRVFGLTVVSCERGDIRQSPDGFMSNSSSGREAIAVAQRQKPRDLVARRIRRRESPYAPSRFTRPLGPRPIWKVCLAAIESSKRGEEIESSTQVSIWIWACSWGQKHAAELTQASVDSTMLKPEAVSHCSRFPLPHAGSFTELLSAG